MPNQHCQTHWRQYVRQSRKYAKKWKCHQHHCFNGCFPGNHGLAGAPWFASSTCFRGERLGISNMGFLMGMMPFLSPIQQCQRITRQRRQFSRTPATLWCWHFLTCQQHSTVSTTTRSFSGCRSPTISTGRSSTGLLRISATQFSTSALRRPAQHQRQLSMEYHRAQSLDRSCFSCTLPTCCSSLNVIISRHTDTQTTPKSTGTVSRLKLVVSYSRFPSALTRFQRGWKQTGCSWILPRLKSSGAHEHGVNTWSRPSLCESATPQCRRSLQSGILVFTSTLTSPWGLMLLTLSERVLQHCVRSAACDGLFLSTPCSHWSQH